MSQGSILGPNLFIIYLNDVAKLSLLSSATLTLYTNDIIPSQGISVQLQCTLFNSTSISLHRGLALVISPSTQKIKYMIISCKSPSLSPLFLNGFQFEHINSFKYLGIIISSNLSWSSHAQPVCSKACQTFWVIYRNFYQHASP